MRIVQLMGNDGFEELYNFPHDVKDEEIQMLYKEWEGFTSEESLKDNSDYTTFEEYLEEYAPQMNTERLFVDEIYV